MCFMHSFDLTAVEAGIQHSTRCRACAVAQLRNSKDRVCHHRKQARLSEHPNHASFELRTTSYILNMETLQGKVGLSRSKE